MKTLVSFLMLLGAGQAFAEAGTKTYINTGSAKLVLEIDLKSDFYGFSDKYVCAYHRGMVEMVATDLEDDTVSPVVKSQDVGIQTEIANVLHDVLTMANKSGSDISLAVDKAGNLELRKLALIKGYSDKANKLESKIYKLCGIEKKSE
jgi:hypothetical protein